MGPPPEWSISQWDGVILSVISGTQWPINRRCCRQWLCVPQEAGDKGCPSGLCLGTRLVPASVSDTGGTKRSHGAFAGHGELSRAGAPRKHRVPAQGRAGESWAGKPGESAQSWPGDLGTWETEPGSELTLSQIAVSFSRHASLFCIFSVCNFMREHFQCSFYFIFYPLESALLYSNFTIIRRTGL